MPRGIFTQCLTVLLREPVDLDAVEASLGAFVVHSKNDAAHHWALSGPSLSLAFRPEVNGFVMVDVVDQPWPDGMGDPHKEETIFTAWTMGHFGPMTYPGSLERAMAQCWAWKDGRKAAMEHRAFARVRTSYMLGASDEAPLVPADWDTAVELRYLTNVVAALLQMPAALCYFNSNGEVLRDGPGVQAEMEHADVEGLLPIDLWANVRKYNYDADWAMMDTVGNGQLNFAGGSYATGEAAGNELHDLEAVFRGKAYNSSEVDDFLREISLHLQMHGDVIQDGHTIDCGPGNVPWRATLPEKAVAMPPRRALRISPVDGSEPPAKPG